MEKLKDKVAKLLRQHFPSAEIELDQANSRDKIGGEIIWKGFAGKEPIDRQHRLWTMLRSQLSEQEQLKVSAILAWTPREFAFITRGGSTTSGNGGNGLTSRPKKKAR